MGDGGAMGDAGATGDAGEDHRIVALRRLGRRRARPTPTRAAGRLGRPPAKALGTTERTSKWSKERAGDKGIPWSPARSGTRRRAASRFAWRARQGTPGCRIGLLRTPRGRASKRTPPTSTPLLRAVGRWVERPGHLPGREHRSAIRPIPLSRRGRSHTPRPGAPRRRARGAKHRLGAPLGSSAQPRLRPAQRRGFFRAARHRDEVSSWDCRGDASG